MHQNHPSYETGRSRGETHKKSGMDMDTKEQDLWFCIESTEVNEIKIASEKKRGESHS